MDSLEKSLKKLAAQEAAPHQTEETPEDKFGRELRETAELQEQLKADFSEHLKMIPAEKKSDLTGVRERIKWIYGGLMSAGDQRYGLNGLSADTDKARKHLQELRTAMEEIRKELELPEKKTE